LANGVNAGLHRSRVISSVLVAETDEVDRSGGTPGVGAQGGGDVVAGAATEERDGAVAADGQGLGRGSRVELLRRARGRRWLR